MEGFSASYTGKEGDVGLEGFSVCYTSRERNVGRACQWSARCYMNVVLVCILRILTVHDVKVCSPFIVFGSVPEIITKKIIAQR